jgi:Ala-tRNA(Pro) deacylase
MNESSKKITDYLDANNIPYETLTHPAVASAEEYHAVLKTRMAQQAKALFVRFKKKESKGFAVVAIQAQKKADLVEICRLLHAREIRLATAEQLKEVTGCNYGELPPMGRLFSLKLIADKDLLMEEKIYFNAGDLTFSVKLNPKDLFAFEDPIMF